MQVDRMDSLAWDELKHVRQAIRFLVLFLTFHILISTTIFHYIGA